MPDTSNSSLRIIVRKRAAQPFFGRHPWLFQGSIAHMEGNFPDAENAVGCPVEVWSHEGAYIAGGLLNPASAIRVRLYSWDQSQPPGPELFRARIRSAVDVRRSLFDLASEDSACRLVFSESDGLSGLIVDRYGPWLLVQFTSNALYQYRECIIEELQKELSPAGIWLRTEKGMREAEGLEAADGLIAGEAPADTVNIRENGLQFAVDVVKGQKTGCYLDQRDNRAAAARFAAGPRLLDAFCFSGGFGITALKLGSAQSVTAVDSSANALTTAARNASLNNVEDRIEFVRSDVRKFLQAQAQASEQYDTVILDPPRMARTRGGLQRALDGYRRLNTDGLNVLRPGGTLVTCSCSGLVSRDDFRSVIADVARTSGRDLRIVQQLSHPPDHPIAATCPETEYLKVLICRAD